MSKRSTNVRGERREKRVIMSPDTTLNCVSKEDLIPDKFWVDTNPIHYFYAQSIRFL